MACWTFPGRVVEYSVYSFKFHYDNGGGDYYTGAVYAPTDYNGYVYGYTQEATDEYGRTGYYEIISVGDMGTDGSNDGQVFVDTYFDADSGASYAPVNNSTALGTNYLGSESGFIIAIDVPSYAFGFGSADYPTTMYEADLISLADLGTLDTPEGYFLIYDINNLGQMVGSVNTGLGYFHAFWYDPATGTKKDLGTLGGTESHANSINDLGQIVGSAFTSSGAAHAFVYDLATSTMTDLGTLEGSYSMLMISIIRGRSSAIRQTPPALSCLCLRPGHQNHDGPGRPGGLLQYAFGINDLGHIVGSASTPQAKSMPLSITRPPTP